MKTEFDHDLELDSSQDHGAVLCIGGKRRCFSNDNMLSDLNILSSISSRPGVG